LSASLSAKLVHEAAQHLDALGNPLYDIDTLLHQMANFWDTVLVRYECTAWHVTGQQEHGTSTQEQCTALQLGAADQAWESCSTWVWELWHHQSTLASLSTKLSTQLNGPVKQAAIHHTGRPCTPEQTPHGVHADVQIGQLGLVVALLVSVPYQTTVDIQR